MRRFPVDSGLWENDSVEWKSSSIYQRIYEEGFAFYVITNLISSLTVELLPSDSRTFKKMQQLTSHICWEKNVSDRSDVLNNYQKHQSPPFSNSFGFFKSPCTVRRFSFPKQIWNKMEWKSSWLSLFFSRKFWDVFGLSATCFNQILCISWSRDFRPSE